MPTTGRAAGASSSTTVESGREEVSRRQSPAGLETVRQVGPVGDAATCCPREGRRVSRVLRSPDAQSQVVGRVVEIGEVPSGVVTLTSAVPGSSSGEFAVTEVAELTVKLVALTTPNLTALAPVNSTPVIVTVVPPPTGPLVGETLVTAGR